MAALLQNLRIHNLELIEQGPNFLIYKNKNVRAPAGLLDVPQREWTAATNRYRGLFN